MKSVLFDFGGTLDADGVTWLERFYPYYREAGLAAERERFARAFYGSDDSLPSVRPLAGLSLEDTVVLQVEGVLARLAPERQDLRDAIAGRYLEEARASFRRNRPLLERLAQRLRLGVVSNFYGNMDSVLRSEGLRDLFSAVSDSEVVGAKKPDSRIFLDALGRLGCGPSEALMVGDSVPRDMRGAEALGMPHALVGRGDAACCPQGRKVATLLDLEAVLS